MDIVKRKDTTSHHETGCCLAAWTPELGLALINKTIPAPLGHNYVIPTLKPMHHNMQPRHNGLSKRSRDNPGRFFPRYLFTTTPTHIDLAYLCSHLDDLPINWLGHNTITKKNDARPKYLQRVYPQSGFTGNAPLYDPQLCRHQSRIMFAHLRRLKDRLQIITRGHFSNRTIFQDDFEYEQWQDNRNTVRVNTAWERHVNTVSHDLDNIDYANVPSENPDFTRDVMARLHSPSRMEKIPGKIRKGKGKGKNKGVLRKTNQPPPMYGELLGRYECASPDLLSDIPLIADFRRQVIPNWSIPRPELYPTIPMFKPRSCDILPTAINHYAIYIRGLTSLFNEHMAILLREADYHLETFPTRLYTSSLKPIGGLLASTNRFGIIDKTLNEYAESVKHLYPGGIFDIDLYSRCWNAILFAHPIIGGANTHSMQHDAAMRAYIADTRPGTMSNRATLTAETLSAVQSTLVYESLEREVINRYIDHACAFGIAPASKPVTHYLALSSKYRAKMRKCKNELQLCSQS